MRILKRAEATVIMRTGENSTETLACLILDDPLLRPRYGCLDYERLLQEMREHGFFTEIAFIPWNWKRNNPKTVQLFADNPDYYAVCVHGCNHTGNEFGGKDYQTLSALAATALWRMEQFKRLTGLSYDPVMVFPQGRFSPAAMQALKDQGYHAAFNSTLQSTAGNEIPAIEYQRPATRIYHDFPLFLRRYPKSKSDFLQDIASGRPIIVVEHHGAFSNGYRAMTDFIDWVNGLGNIKWTSLSSITNAYCSNTKSMSFDEKSDELVWSLWDQSKVALRRFACEFRDNYVEPSSILTRIYRTGRGHVTGVDDY
ncbi:MAG: hypothetical protein JXB30_00350 [Anaerolineae bacterium]|nr:hypothetical protein [Anaerolineae bacterium]